MVSSDGPESHANPSRAIRPHFPPGASPASSTVTAWPAAASRTAVASPPTPAPTTATLIGARRVAAGARAPRSAPIAAAPAAATRGRRQSAALANVSPAQVQA